MSLTIELRSWEEFKRFLRDFGPRVRIAMDKATEESSRLIAQSAKTKAPVRTGKLKASIKPSGFVIEAGAPYSRFVEFGTRKMEGQPFLSPAIEENVGKVRNIFRTKIEDELKKGLR